MKMIDSLYLCLNKIDLKKNHLLSEDFVHNCFEYIVFLFIVFQLKMFYN